MPLNNPPTLTVPRAPLITAAKRLTRAATEKRIKAAEVVLRFEERHLFLEVPGGTDAVPATGCWPGSLRVSGMVLILFAKGEWPAELIELSYADGYLHIRVGGARIKYQAHWQDISTSRIDIALDATDRDYLRLPLTYAPAQITSSGLDKQVAAAEERLQKDIDRAFAVLAPYLISRSHLEEFVRLELLKSQ